MSRDGKELKVPCRTITNCIRIKALWPKIKRKTQRTKILGDEHKKFLLVKLDEGPTTTVDEIVEGLIHNLTT